MNKLYDRIDFVNNTTPALNQTNLNKMSKAIDDIDDRVIEIADDVLVVVPEILDKYADIEALATNPPYVGQNGHWWTWDTDLNQYVDSGVDAGVSVTVGTTTTLSPGSSATVTNSGTDTDPILNFGIPQGVAGQNGQDGADGVGVPSGGTTGQVLKKKSGTDYDTEWANESGGGSGGHTIINSAGTDMTQRTGLQFSGLNVTDDSGNDKTVVTLPTPDYVDEQFNPSTTYSKGMTCIEGNVRYRYKNSTPTSGHRPPDATYWEVYSVADEISATPVLFGTIADCSVRGEQIINNSIDAFAYKYLRFVFYKGYFCWEKTISTDLLQTILNGISWQAQTDKRLTLVDSFFGADRFQLTLGLSQIYSGHNYTINGHTIEIDNGGLNTSILSGMKLYLYVSN